VTHIAAPKSLVLLGMMSKMPVAGVILQTVHYLIGLQRLGFDVYYVEAHGCTPRNFIRGDDDDGFANAAAFIERIMRQYGFDGRWCYHPVHGDCRYFGLSQSALAELYARADLIINLHGGTEPLPEHSSTARLIYLETDPVQLQIELYNADPRAIRFLEPHSAFFSFGENLGNPDCILGLSRQFQFRPTRQPVLTDFWTEVPVGAGETFTTIGNWQQPYREVYFRGEVYQWSKHAEFVKFLELPRRTAQPFELALSSYTEEERNFLGSAGWKVRHALDLSTEVDSYVAYIAGSRGEFTVAKDIYVRLRTGWFSDRSATYLAAGRPVITQDTGFGNGLPTGTGLFAFRTMDDLLASVEEVSGDYSRHCNAAREIAREFFDAEVVLDAMLAHLGITRHRLRPTEPFPSTMVLRPIRRRPIELPAATARLARSTRLPPTPAPAVPQTSIIVVTFNNLTFTRLCLAALLTHTADAEIVVVDNASTDGTSDYLRHLQLDHPQVRCLFNAENAGFAAANNQGLKEARGRHLVLLNNDTIVPAGWLDRLTAHLDSGAVGAVGPVTNRIGNEAEVEADCATYGEYVRSAKSRAAAFAGKSFEIPTLTMFCLAMRREVFEKVGPIDERFERGMLEDDDYSRRLRAAGLRLICAEDVLVYHFGQASFGDLVPSGEYAEILARNQRRFLEKWGEPWKPYRRRLSAGYEEDVARLCEIVVAAVPPGARVLVVSRGDEALLALGKRDARHFPANSHGAYAGHHPADSDEALALLETERRNGAAFLVLPAASRWWLDYYEEFARFLSSDCELVASESAGSVFQLPTP